MATRGEAAMTASRDACLRLAPARHWAPPAALRHRPRPAGSAPDLVLAGLDLRLFLLLERLLLALLFHLRIADEILPADHHDERQHDGNDGVLVLAHSVLVLRSFDCAVSADRRAPASRMNLVANPLYVRSRALPVRRTRLQCDAAPTSSSRGHLIERTVAAPCAVRSARNRGRRANAVSGLSRTISRRRRRTRLRSTALPTCLRDGEAYPHRAVSSRRRALQHERPFRRPRASWRRSPKVRPAFQALHGIDFGIGFGACSASR